ncbi:hypothetical protein [Brevundimonas sp. Root1423]|uniref:hypothetical protein n=1 Tax=Brevundimonas sp. Root1423 TaxID=1736462 RepID=UPI0006FC0295|nr:hypothetical protein [Brevundimonas sp. Root1423]KQY91289.1 hypothetical protein ASD25_19195 [Brevundimonas sp. Root1423]
MLYPNVAARFFTSAGDNRGTSAYFVYANGVLRAKTATQTLHVRPDKNLCFVRSADADTVLDEGVARVAHNGADVTLTLNNAAVVAARKASGGGYDTPVDFFLNNDGAYASGQHVGHAITNAFDAGNSGITVNDINRVKATQVNPADTAITGANGDVAIDHQ